MGPQLQMPVIQLKRAACRQNRASKQHEPGATPISYFLLLSRDIVKAFLKTLKIVKALQACFALLRFALLCHALPSIGLLCCNAQQSNAKKAKQCKAKQRKAKQGASIFDTWHF